MPTATHTLSRPPPYHALCRHNNNINNPHHHHHKPYTPTQAWRAAGAEVVVSSLPRFQPQVHKLLAAEWPEAKEDLGKGIEVHRHAWMHGM